MLAGLTAAGWDCHVALPGPARLRAEYAAAGIAVHDVDLDRLTTQGGAARAAARYALRWPAAVWHLTRLARRLDVDVVHTNSLHCWHGWAVGRLLRRPHVWHAREIVVQSGAALVVERYLARHFADRVVAVSDAVAEQLDRRNVIVVRDVAPPGIGPWRAGRWRRAAGVPDDALLVGTTPRIDTWKGVDTFLDAVPEIRRRCPGAEFLVAGSAVGGKEDYAAALAARAEELGVRWLGPLRDVSDLMADLDVLVQVSSEPEPWGLVYVEALASGAPVVAGDSGGPVELLSALDEGAGRLVPAREPAALAAAVLDLLPACTSTARRAERPSRRPPAGPGIAPILAAVLSRRPAAGLRR